MIREDGERVFNEAEISADEFPTDIVGNIES